MELRPPECTVLSSRLGVDPPCRVRCNDVRTPSYHGHKGEPKGCWIAHTTLCLSELMSLRRLIEPTLNRLSNSLNNISWRHLVYTVALHDVGKLTEDYIAKRPRTQHSVVSGCIAYEALKGLLGEAPSIAIAQACFLHMEHYLWRQLDWPSLALTVSERPRQLSTRTGLIIDALKQCLTLVSPTWDEGLLKALDQIPRMRSIKPMKKIFSQLLPESIALLWLILLIDNRAASAREGATNYWRNKVHDTLLSSGSGDGEPKPVKLAKLLVRSGIWPSTPLGPLTPTSSCDARG